MKYILLTKNKKQNKNLQQAFTIRASFPFFTAFVESNEFAMQTFMFGRTVLKTYRIHVIVPRIIWKYRFRKTDVRWNETQPSEDKEKGDGNEKFTPKRLKQFNRSRSPCYVRRWVYSCTRKCNINTKILSNCPTGGRNFSTSSFQVSYLQSTHRSQRNCATLLYSLLLCFVSSLWGKAKSLVWRRAHKPPPEMWLFEHSTSHISTNLLSPASHSNRQSRAALLEQALAKCW